MEVNLTFLEGPIPLTKTYTKVKGELTKTPYPQVKNFTSHQYMVKSLPAMEKLLTEHAAKGHCLMRGSLVREIQHESRAGLTDNTLPSHFIPLDVDGLEDPNDVDDFMALLPHDLPDVDYLVQYSPSAGLEGNTALHAHIFVLCANAVTSEVYKKFLTRLNLEHPKFRAALRLSRTGNALKYAVDVSIADASKLIYLAPPKLGANVRTSFKGDRIRYVRKRKRASTIDWTAMTFTDLEAEKLKALNELRRANGYTSKRTITEKLVGDVLVQNVTGACEVTGVKIERGFAYLNLNGGDSWGYYHPLENPDILYNFKGEPNYLTRDLVPSYYAQAVTTAEQARDEIREVAREIAAEANNAAGWEYFTVIDRTTSEFIKGAYHPSTNDLDVQRAPSLYIIKNYQRLHGLEMTANLEEWDVTFDPTSTVRYNPDVRAINTYRPTQYYLDPPKPRRLHPVAERVIRHATGDDPVMYTQFINWLAYIFQYRTKTQTAFVLQGTYGTGKGIIFNEIIQPILGFDYTPRVDMEVLVNSEFNGYLKEAILALFDEVNLDSMQRKKRQNKLMKELITEPSLSIREMHVGIRKLRSFLNALIFANEDHSAWIMPGDRRYNVAPRQEKPLQITTEEIEQLRAALPQIAGFFLHYEVDHVAAHTPIENDAKAFIQRLSLSSDTEAINALRNADFDFFIDNAPAIERPWMLQDLTGQRLPSYAECMHQLAQYGQHGKVPRDIAQVLLYYTLGVAQPSAHKFSKWLAHNKFSVRRIKMGKDVHQGIQTAEWHATPEQLKQIAALAASTSTTTQPQLRTVK